jgi:hypothetical protein
VHRKNLIMSRENAFALTQEQSYKNLTQIISPMLGGSWGVIADMDGSSLISGTSNLKVSGIGNSIAITKGTAISMTGEMIYCGENVPSYSIPSEAGIKYVTISPQLNRVASGAETYLPGHIGTNGILTLENDGFYINISEKYDATSVSLAKYHAGPGGIINNEINGEIKCAENRPFIDSDDIGVFTVQNFAIPTPLIKNDDDYFVVLINNEYIGCSSISTSEIVITERGLFNTSPAVHRHLSTITYPFIIDLRQTNTVKFKLGDNTFVAALKKGVINFNDGSGDRFLGTKKIADIPNTPAITSKDISLIWLNKHTTGGFVTNDLRNTIGQIKGYSDKIHTTQADIMSIRESLLKEEDSEIQIELQSQLIDKQAEVAQLNVAKQQGSLSVSRISKVTNNIKKKYVAALTFNQPTLIDNEQISKYEAEVYYMPISGKSSFNSKPSQMFSKAILPSSINEFGDYKYTYDIQPNEEYRTIYIPIKVGEKVRVRVRSIAGAGLSSTWSEYAEYEFTKIDDMDIAVLEDLDELLRPDDPFAAGLITAETIEMIKQSVEAVTALATAVEINSAAISAIKEELNIIETTVAEIANPETQQSSS